MPEVEFEDDTFSKRPNFNQQNDEEGKAGFLLQIVMKTKLVGSVKGAKILLGIVLGILSIILGLIMFHSKKISYPPGISVPVGVMKYF